MAGDEHIRYFIALPVPAPAPTAALLAALQSFAPQVKPVDAAGLHLTLRFFGPASNERVRDFASALDAAVTDTTPGPITLHWQAPAFFPSPSPKRARTIVLPPANLGPDSALDRLEAALTDALQRLDRPIDPDQRAFHPHLTLARLKKPRGKHRVPLEALEATLARYARTTFSPATLDRAVLFQSTLTPQGPHYQVMHEVAL